MRLASVLLLLMYQHPADSIFLIPSFSDIKEIAGFAYDVYSKFNEAYDLYGTYTADIGLDNILEKVNDISNRVNQMGNKLEQKIDEAVQILLKRLPLTAQVDASLYDLHNYIARVDALFAEYLFYTEKRDHFNNYTMQRFTDAVTSPRANDLPDTLFKMHRLVAASRTSIMRRGIFFLLNKQQQISHRETCDTGDTPQLQLFQIYATIMVTEIRGYVMTGFSYVVLKTILGVPFTGELEKAKEQFLKRAKDYLSEVRKALKYTARDSRRCDPPHHKRNKTFVEFYGFIQGYIANEQKLNADNSCSGTCESLTQPTKQYGCQNTDPYFCPFNQCFGKVMNCTTPGSGRWDICEYERKSPRRYGWFKGGNDVMHGEKDTCPGGHPNKPKGFWQGAYWCDYCACICVADNIRSPARRIISLRPQISDINSNMAVSGIRFVDESDMIHVQIRQGKLEPEGRINATTIKWKTLEKFQFDESKTLRTGTEYIDKDRHAHIEGRPAGTQFDRMAYGRDFAVLQWHQKQINLDDIYAPTNHVVTGIRFRHPKKPARNESQPIQLAIHVTLFNYTSGLLSNKSEDSSWITPDKMDNPPAEYLSNRTEFDMKGRVGNPTKSLINHPDSKPNSYVILQASGFVEDAAQSTVPFLDSQPVHGEPDFVLGGVGLFHKGDTNYGGFLAFKIFSIDYSQYLDNKLPDEFITGEFNLSSLHS